MPEKQKHGHWLTIAICTAIVLAVLFALLAPHAARGQFRFPRRQPRSLAPIS